LEIDLYGIADIKFVASLIFATRNPHQKTE